LSTTANTPFIGQAALVTGGAVRLGKAIALALAEAGFDIALHYNSSQTPAAQTQTEIRQKQVKCAIFQQNLVDVSGLETLIGRAQEIFPNLRVLINSASGYQAANITDTTPELFAAMTAVNLRAPFFLSQAFAKVVGKGNIINIIDNKIGFNQYHYAAYLLSKKSLAELTRMAAVELAPDIRVNGVAPGVVLPSEKRNKAYVDWRVQGIPLKRHGRADHITQAILHILQNDFLNGQIIVVDGGESLTNVGLNSINYGSGANKEDL